MLSRVIGIEIVLKGHWELEELVEHWTLLPQELELLGNKTDATRLGFAISLKYFQLEMHFPALKPAIPKSVVEHVAAQVQVPPDKYHRYSWTSRNAKYHRGQIREFFGYREARTSDSESIINWLIDKVLTRESDINVLQQLVKEQFWALKIEPPTAGRIERLIRSALRTHESRFFRETARRLSFTCRHQIDTLLVTSDKGDSSDDQETGDTLASPLSELNTEPGRSSVNSVLKVSRKLQDLRQIGLPRTCLRTSLPKSYKPMQLALLLNNHGSCADTDPLLDTLSWPRFAGLKRKKSLIIWWIFSFRWFTVLVPEQRGRWNCS